MKGKTNNDNWRKKYVPVKPKQGFLADTKRNFFTDLTKVRHLDLILVKVLKFAEGLPGKGTNSLICFWNIYFSCIRFYLLCFCSIDAGFFVIQLYLIRNPDTSVSLWILKKISEQLFYRTPPGDYFWTSYSSYFRPLKKDKILIHINFLKYLKNCL